MSLNRLLIFTDFTDASAVAAQHCFQMASLCDAEVFSLHAISHDEDRDWAEKKSAEQIRKIGNYDENLRFTPLASGQNLFLGMNKWLEEHQVDLTFMATHGKKDLQFVTGSLALKLIFNAETPTLVVQAKTSLRPYHHILLPVFSHQAEMQFPIHALKATGKIFGARLTLLTYASKDQKERVETEKTIEWVKSALEKDFASIRVKNSEQPEKKFSQITIDTAIQDNIDLIAVMIGAKHHREHSIKKKGFYQDLITNKEQVPVLCL